jgi:hypothetical protein
MGLLTSTNNTRTLRNMATELRNRFPRDDLTELTSAEPEAWAKESFEIASKIAYQNGALRGTPKENGETAVKSRMRPCCRTVM